MFRIIIICIIACVYCFQNSLLDSHCVTGEAFAAVSSLFQHLWFARKAKNFLVHLLKRKGGGGEKHIYVAYLYLYYWLEIKGGRVRLVRLHVALQSNSVCDRPLHVSPYCAHIKLKSGDTTTRSIFQDRFSSTPLHFLFERFVFPFLLFLPVF